MRDLTKRSPLEHMRIRLMCAPDTPQNVRLPKAAYKAMVELQNEATIDPGVIENKHWQGALTHLNAIVKGGGQ